MLHVVLWIYIHFFITFMNKSQQDLYLPEHMLFLTRGGLKQMTKKRNKN